MPSSDQLWGKQPPCTHCCLISICPLSPEDWAMLFSPANLLFSTLMHIYHMVSPLPCQLLMDRRSTLSKGTGGQYQGGEGWGGSRRVPVPPRGAVTQLTATVAKCHHAACCGVRQSRKAYLLTSDISLQKLLSWGWGSQKGS